MSKLTKQQQGFCNDLLADPEENQQHAYEKHYSARGASARSSASKLLTNPNVAAYLKERREALKKRAEEKFNITQDRVVEELGRLGFSNLQDYVEWGPDGVILKNSSDIPPNLAAAISEVSQTVTDKGGSLRIKLHDKPSSLNMLGRKFGMFTDKVEVSGHVSFEQGLAEIEKPWKAGKE